ncbi:MAG: ATP-dependent Clp protease proteolytic subunit [Elusimicrobia bacterium]|nr:ATP-dependent Clp protease proteolytic subunit [Elusimicrobiota bacterium]
MPASRILLTCLLSLAFYPLSLRAQAAAPQGQVTDVAIAGQERGAQAPQLSPEQTELAKLTTENLLSDQKLKKKLQQLNDEKEELRAKYELSLQKEKTKIAEMDAELDRLSTENKLSAEQYQSQIKILKADLEKAETENKLADEKHKAEISQLDNEYQKLTEQNKLAQEQTAAQLFKQNKELDTLTLENKIYSENNKKALQALSGQLDQLRLGNDLIAEQQRKQLTSDATEKSSLELELKRLEVKERKLNFERLTFDSRMDKLKSDLELRGKKEEWKKQANTEPVYLDNPFRDGRLVVSDRRISLNGPIFTGAADYITERISYYNNISTSPIFIVIDRSPGGSVMEGYRIIKAMQASRAPVSVVVKSFAASMAAVIATLAEKSYVYPNAILLHHQMSTVNWGNMTQLKEQLELAREWERRLHVPVAKKMGVSLDEFRKMMYEKNSNGDWEEFGDKAVNYHWATSVVNEIDETGFVKNPDENTGPSKTQEDILNEKTDEKGQRYVSLPRLEPFDFYFIYNPDRYFR